MTNVVLNPAFDIFYNSFYLHGLLELFGSSRIEYASRSFPRLSSGCLALLVRGTRELRVIIDPYDGAVITNYNRRGLEWCDVYAKVNLASTLVPEDQRHKCLPIGPSFPVRLWGPMRSAWMAARTYRTSVDYAPRLQGINNSREHFANYSRQYRYALPLQSFVRTRTRDGYIYFLSSLWREEEAPGTNEYRARFIECCKANPAVVFEGGLVSSEPETSPPSDRFAGCMASGRVPLQEWLHKTQLSSIVFNTPAVWSCHGFKLAEFLALGKAIISTPLARELPAPLVHGQHIHYVDGSADAIRAAVDLLLSNREYRHHLEQNAQEYYERVLRPTRPISRLLDLAVSSGAAMTA
jgi:hypothetical protein